MWIGVIESTLLIESVSKRRCELTNEEVDEMLAGFLHLKKAAMEQAYSRVQSI